VLKGKIDQNGILFIERGKYIKPQRCPSTTAWIPNPDTREPVPVNMHCGDWCPKFGEPIKSSLTTTNGTQGKALQYKVTICDKVLIFDELDDNRWVEIVKPGEIIK